MFCDGNVRCHRSCVIRLSDASAALWDPECPWPFQSLQDLPFLSKQRSPGGLVETSIGGFHSQGFSFYAMGLRVAAGGNQINTWWGLSLLCVIFFFITKPVPLVNGGDTGRIQHLLVNSLEVNSGQELASDSVMLKNDLQYHARCLVNIQTYLLNE